MKLKLKEQLLSGVVYLAQTEGVDNPFFRSLGPHFGTQGPAGSQNIGQLITQIIQVMLLVSAGLAVVYFLVGGYRYIIAHGNEESTEGAKHTMTAAIWGLVYIIMAFAFITIIANLLLGGIGGAGI